MARNRAHERKAARLYGDGLSTRQIARRLGCAMTTAWKWARQGGAAMRPQGRYRMVRDWQAAATLYRAGWSAETIAIDLGCHPSTVRDAIRRLGEPIRPQRGGRCSTLAPVRTPARGCVQPGAGISSPKLPGGPQRSPGALSDFLGARP